MTPGAQRSLERATQLAVSHGANSIDTNHMLWALWLDEGNAAAVLSALGVRGEQIEIPFNSQTNQSLVSVETATMADAILLEARQFVRRFDPRSGELTSEHLLLALTVTDPARLRGLGITQERVIELIAPDHDTSSVPVGPEYQLGCSETTPPPDQQEPDPTNESPTITRDQTTEIYRTIDAAANRVREGLRVVEDYVRFVLSDRIINQELKSCRHLLSQVLSQLNNEVLVRCRNTLGDTGTSASTPHEHQRSSLQSLTAANMKRVQEGLRTLEEFLKLIQPDASASSAIEQIRYQSYTIEKAIATTVAANNVLAGRVLYMLVTEKVCQRPWKDVVIDALAGGVGIVQLREKALPDEEIVRRGRWLRHETEKSGALFIMNDRPDLAAATDADGVHIGQSEVSVAAARQVLGPTGLIGVSTHNTDQARAAVLDGADYLGVGPVFPTNTKEFEEYAELAYVTQIAQCTSLPWFAIGGINGANVSQAMSAGATRIAVSAAICGSSNVEKSAKLLVNTLV